MFESVGFSHEQAEVLAETIEEAQTNGLDSLKEFIRIEIGWLENRLDNKITSEINRLDNKITNETNSIRSEIKDLEVRMAIAQKDLLIKIFTIIVGTVGMAVTILKLFP